MYSPLRLPINQFYKNATKMLNSCTKNSLQNSNIIVKRFHENPLGIIAASKTCESNLAYTGLFTDCKSIQSDSNKFPRQVKSEPLHSNLESLLSSRCDKLMEHADANRYETHQLHKVPPFEISLGKYRLSYYRESPEYYRDDIEAELFEFQHILDPSYKVKISEEFIKEMEQRRQHRRYIRSNYMEFDHLIST